MTRGAIVWDIFGSIAAVAKLASETLYRFWGGRTREQDRLESELDDALEQKRQALAQGLIDQANHWDAEAGRIRREIAAKYPG